MELHLFEADELPVPRADMRLVAIDITPYSDGRRVKVAVEMTQFSERPNLDLMVLNPAGELLSVLSVIESLERRLNFTIHLRGATPGPDHVLRVVLFYPPSLQAREADPEAPDQVVDTRDLTFTVPDGDAPVWDDAPDPDHGTEAGGEDGDGAA